MNLKTAVIIIFLSLFSRDANSSCMGCLETYGIKATLKDGSAISGYVPWNNGYYPTEKWIEDINNWLSQKGVTREEMHTNKDLMLYKQWEEIKRPVHKYFAVSEEAVSIPWSKIQKLEFTADLPLKVDVSNLAVLSLADIRELQNNISYYFSEESGAGPLVFYVGISSSITPMNLLRHFFEEKGMGLSFNGEALDIERYDFGKFSLNCVGKLSRYPKACAKFRSDWEKYQDEMDRAKFCRKEYTILFDSLRGTTDYYSMYKIPKIQEKESECKTLEDAPKQKYGFLGIWKAEELRKYGVIVFGLGAD